MKSGMIRPSPGPLPPEEGEGIKKQRLPHLGPLFRWDNRDSEASPEEGEGEKGRRADGETRRRRR